MKILIFGSSGFLGKKLVKFLNKEKNLVVFKTLRKKKSISDRNSFFCDLKDIPSVKNVLNILSPDIVVNLGAEVSFKKKTDDMFLVNSVAPKIIANYCGLNHIYYIHASGILVHGFHNKLFSNKTAYNPDTEYGKSKLIGDLNIIKSGCFYSLLRFPGIYGFAGPDHLGINVSIKNALNNKKPILFGNGLAKRNYIFVEDAAKIIINLIKKKNKGIFYLGGQTVTFEKMFKDIYNLWFPNFKIMKKESKKNIYDQISIVSRQFSNYTSFNDSLKKINKDKLKHVQ